MVNTLTSFILFCKDLFSFNNFDIAFLCVLLAPPHVSFLINYNCS